MHNLRTVFAFEVTRTLKRKSFWLLALVFPAMLGLIFAIVFFSNKTTESALKDMQKQQFSMVVKDDSGLVQPALLKTLGIAVVTSKAAGVQAVQRGERDAFFYYPADLKAPVQVYGKDVGIFTNSRYAAAAKSLMDESVGTAVAPNIRAVVGDTVQYQAVFYKDGVTTDPMKRMIAPGVFLVLFYFLIALFGNQALTSTTEEKENRVVEILLTTVEPKALITGKVAALSLLALIQAVLIVVPAIVLYVLLRHQLALPTFDLTNIPVDVPRVIGAVLVTGLSILLFLALLLTIGAAVPTAKEAGGFMGVVMMCIFGPLYAATLFVSSPHTVFVLVLTYFPFTAPIPLLLRNAAGTISLAGLLLGALLLAVSAWVVIRIAVRTFRFGALEYDRKLTLREIFTRR